MLTLDGLLGDLTEQAEGVLADHHGDTALGGTWREDPVSLAEFITSREHLNLKPFYARQAKAINALLGGDPKRIFEEPEPPRQQLLDWQPLKRSSNVRRAAYAASEGALYVQFRGSTTKAGVSTPGGVYRYAMALPEHLDGLTAAKSPGSFLNAEVKHRLANTRLDDNVDPDTITETIAGSAARAYQLAVLLWGKGSGKDYICSIVVLYLVYVLLCLRNPQAYLDQAPGEPIDVVNVAYNADQAKKVFFEKFKERLARWRWVRKNFDLWEAGRRKWKENAGLPKVEVNDGEVLWPRKIRCFSRHAQNESYEGLNVVAWIMDEASAFLSKLKEENAEKIYQTLRSSAVSRFGLRWVGFIISYPRHADDFTFKKLRAAQADPALGMYADGPAATWDVNEGTARQQRVEVRPGYWVPVEFANDYMGDFDEARSRYECAPPLARDALIKRPERVWQAVEQGRKPLIEYDEIVSRRDGANGQEREFAAVRISQFGKLPKGARLFLHGDPARTSDAFALAIGHGAPATVMTYVPAGEVLTARQREQHQFEVEDMVPWERDVTRTVIDAVIVWRPDPRRDRQVDLINVQDVLWQIINHYGRSSIGMVTFDQYDSAETIQRLDAKKVPSENEQWSNPFQHLIYRGGRSAFYNDLVTLPDIDAITSQRPEAPGMIHELIRVEEIDGHKIDHPDGGSKDLADAVVRVIHHVTGAVLSGRLSFGKVDGNAGTDTGRGPVPGKKINPKAAPSPITHGDRAMEAKRAAERPEAEIEQGTGAVIPTRRLAFGSTLAGR